MGVVEVWRGGNVANGARETRLDMLVYQETCPFPWHIGIRYKRNIIPQNKLTSQVTSTTSQLNIF